MDMNKLALCASGKCFHSGQDGQPKMIPLSPEESRQILDERRKAACSLVQNKTVDSERLKLQAWEKTFAPLRFALTRPEANALFLGNRSEKKAVLFFEHPKKLNIGRQKLELNLGFDQHTDELTSFDINSQDDLGNPHSFSSKDYTELEDLLNPLADLYRNSIQSTDQLTIPLPLDLIQKGNLTLIPSTDAKQAGNTVKSAA